MERSEFKPLAPSSEPNPLRPYYRPPSIGIPDSSAQHANSSSGPGASGASRRAPSFGSSARDILSDLNYDEFLGEGGGRSTMQSAKHVLDQAVWKYSSVFMAQPFELAKMVLQVRGPGSLSVPQVNGKRPQYNSVRSSAGGYEDYDDDEDDEEPSYFTSTAPQNSSQYRQTSPRQRRRPSPPRSTSSSRRPQQPVYKLELRKVDSITEILSQLWQREGAWGIWKGTNVTFLYGLLLKTIETWSRSMLAAVFNLPDPGMMAGSSGGFGGLDIIDSPYPVASLCVAVAAAGIAGFVLAPLDIVRTRIMMTATSEPPRSILPTLRSLTSWTCPSSILAPTLLHSTLPTFISSSTPLFLRSSLRIDPIITPTMYSVCTFLSSTAELFIRLPVETVLRRGQIKVVSEQHDAISHRRSSKGKQRSRYDEEDSEPSLPTVVDAGPYTGLFGTMWRIVREEGESTQMTTKPPPGTQGTPLSIARKKGQGVHGLWRGWRVGWWGLVGVWGAAALGGAGGKGGEF